MWYVKSSYHLSRKSLLYDRQRKKLSQNGVAYGWRKADESSECDACLYAVMLIGDVTCVFVGAIEVVVKSL